MIEAICNSLTKKIIQSVDGYDESKADEINYGLQLLIGEVPKLFIILLLAFLLHMFKLTLISLLFCHIELFQVGFTCTHILVALLLQVYCI